MPNLIQRFQSQTPTIFKKIIKFSLGLSGLSLAILALTQIPGLIVPSWIVSSASDCAIGSTVVSFLAKFTTQEDVQS